MIRPLIILFILAIIGGYVLGENHKDRERQRAAESERQFVIAEPDDLFQASYLQVDQIVIPFFKNGRTTAYIMAEVSLETSTEPEYNALRNAMPRIQSTIRRALTLEAARGAFDGDTADIDELGAAVRDALNKLFPEAPRPPVEAVFFRRLLLEGRRVS